MYLIEIPPIDPVTKIIEGQVMIFDQIRKKHLVLTPEELVRQGVIHHLINRMKYPRSLISVEREVKTGKKKNRSDIYIMGRNSGYFMVVECKSFREKINQSTFDQAAKYCNALKADYLLVTNGMQSFCCRIDHNAKTTIFLKELPIYPGD